MEGGEKYAGIQRPRELGRRAWRAEGEAMRSDSAQRDTAKSGMACGCRRVRTGLASRRNPSPEHGTGGSFGARTSASSDGR